MFEAMDKIRGLSIFGRLRAADELVEQTFEQLETS
jgi:hypothetical protein